MAQTDVSAMFTTTNDEHRNKSYSIYSRVVFAVVTMLLLVVGCGGWAAIADLSGAVITTGSVVIERHVKKVQHRDGGIVAQIQVTNGERVRAGQLLLRLDDTSVRAELGVIRSQLLELRARSARLMAERELAERISFPEALRSDPEAQLVIAGEERLFANSREARDTQKRQLGLRIKQLEQETKGVSAQRDAKLRELTLIKRELEPIRTLYDNKLVTANRVYALEREDARLAGEHGNYIAQGARIAGQISEINLQILNIDLTLKSDAQRELRTLEARVAELLEREIAASDRLSRTDIRAPQDGVVHELAVHTVGGVITPAETAMLIVPHGEALSVEVKLPPVSIEQVHIGQEVRLRFTGFNQRTTPIVLGRISFIAPDISQDAKTRTEYYAARVELTENNDWEIGGKKIVPGMPVEAHITTEKRTALSYLVKPVVDQFSRAGRER